MESRQYTTIIVIILLLIITSCSPYVYEKEITTFGEGVEKSSQAMLELKEQRIAYLKEKRNKELLANKETIDFNSKGCDELRKKYLESISKGIHIDNKAFLDCYVTPKGISTDPKLSNIMLLSDGIKKYSAALISLTKASDDDDLKNAFSEFNNSTKNMLEALNKKLDEKKEKKYDAISGLIWSVGSISLKQRRFNALKKGVNQSHQIINKASELLQEAAFYLHENKIDTEYRKMLNYANYVDTSRDYLAQWKEMDQITAAYINSIQNSPVNSFRSLSEAHTALKMSLNDPKNQKQLNAVFENAKSFKDNAEAALEALK